MLITDKEHCDEGGYTLLQHFLVLSRIRAYGRMHPFFEAGKLGLDIA